MLESHSLGLVFMFTIFFYFYRGIQEDRIRTEVLLAQHKNKDAENKFVQETGTVQMSDNMDNMDALFEW